MNKKGEGNWFDFVYHLESFTRMTTRESMIKEVNQRGWETAINRIDMSPRTIYSISVSSILPFTIFMFYLLCI